MKKVKLQYLFYFLFLLTNFLWYAFYTQRSQWMQVGLAIFSVAFFCIGTFLHLNAVPNKEKWRHTQISVSILLCYYVIILLDILFVGKLFLIGGRLSGGINLAPFTSIGNYLTDIITNHSGWASVNLFGNLFLFSPMGIFLPLLFPKMRKLFPFLLFMFCVLIGVEILQYIANAGSTDIDDFILNLLGAVSTWILVNVIKKTKDSLK